MIHLALLLFAAHALAADDLPACNFAEEQTSLHLITVSPGESVDKIFGHTAILVWEPGAGERSTIYDFGWADVSDPMFVVDVLNATQDYSLATWTFSDFTGRIPRQERGAVAQRLDLPPSKAREVTNSLKAIAAGDSTFRYNWYRPNCTTKVADMLDIVLDGALKPQHAGSSLQSPARQVLRHSAAHPPLWFGLHWGSGRVADQDISWWDAMFLPSTLMERLRVSTILSPDGTQRPLVDSECRMYTPILPEPLATAPWRDPHLGVLGLFVGGLLGAIGARSRSAGTLAVGGFGVGLGLFGCAALLVGLLGTFAPFWGHHNLFFASPLSGLLAGAAWLSRRDPSHALPTRLAGGLVGLALLGVAASASHAFADRNLGIAALVLPSLFAAVWVLRRNKQH